MNDMRDAKLSLQFNELINEQARAEALEALLREVRQRKAWGTDDAELVARIDGMLTQAPIGTSSPAVTRGPDA